MTNKLSRFIFRSDFIRSNRVPGKRSRFYLVKQMCHYRTFRTSAALKGAIGLLHWMKARTLRGENRIPYRVGCFLTGRNRGTSRRFTVARTKMKFFSAQARLIGLRKSSW